MNILHLLSWFPKPNDPTLGNFCIRMIDALPHDCHSVILSVCDGQNLSKPFVVETIEGTRHTHIQIRIRPPKNAALRKLKLFLMYQYGLCYIKKHYFNPDLIHLHVSYPLGRMALLWHKLYGYRYVLTEHWTIYQPQNKEMMQGALKRNILRVANQASVIMPVSLNLQHCMEGHGVRNHFQVIYNLVDTSVFHLGTTAADNGKKQILHISTLRDEAKNFSGLLRTIERLRQQRDDFELHVIHDYEAPEFKAFVREHHLDDCVIFHGKKTSTKVAEAYAQSDFFVLFSNFENLPCVLVEAFASGVPVVTTDVGGIAEIVSPERGILIPQANEQALLEALSLMLDTHGNYDRQAIRHYALQTFDSPVIGQQIYEEYLKVVKD